MSMEPIPAPRHPPKSAKTPTLGHERRGRFLLLFDRWLRKFHTLGHGLQQAGMRRCVYYRWKTGQVIRSVPVCQFFQLVIAGLLAFTPGARCGEFDFVPDHCADLSATPARA